MRYVTWNDVGTPQLLVYTIKTASPSCFLDVLVHQLIYRNKPRVGYVYHCPKCHQKYTPDKMSEEISSCPYCNSFILRTTTTYKWAKGIPKWSTTDYVNNIIYRMSDNYFHYHGVPPRDEFDCGWRDGRVYGKFPDGEEITEFTPKLCIIKAALLCPFLWDMKFNWDNPDDPINTNSLSHMLIELAKRK